MLEPQGTFFFLLLLLGFGGLMVWLALTKQVVFRVLAAMLAFIPAMGFGIAAVNKYYDYYQTWGALFSDISGQSGQTATQLSAAGLGKNDAASISAQLARTTNPTLDAQDGYLFRTVVTGPKSHITREVYIYLPPQYFSKAYAKYTFPAVELLHGSPGQPESWINVMDLIPIYLHLLATHKADPAVIVMPDTEGGLQYSLQCLNAPGGLQDMTFVGKEVPDWVSDNLRVQRPNLTWGIAGYSEGGFCAANIALQEPYRYGYAGSLSGYFEYDTSQVPLDNKPNGRPVDVNVYKRYPKLALMNTPEKYILHMPVGLPMPEFWLAAGAEDTQDVQQADTFQQLLLTREAQVPLTIIPGGGHQAKVWRAALGPMLQWMTAGLAYQVQLSAHAAPVPKHHAAVKRDHPVTTHRVAPRSSSVA